jgi:hypothetical protein
MTLFGWSLPRWSAPGWISWVSFLFLLGIGIALRTLDFGIHPGGLHQDEASIAVEASSLYSYGVDRNGESFPIHFIAWGSGQNVLYAYALFPLVPFGLTPDIIRLPMLLSGILTMLLVFGIARRLFSPSVAWFSLALMVVNPWHIMLSRWALESNFLPFWFALAVYCLTLSKQRPIFFAVTGAILGVCLYAYGTAYLVVPLFFIGLLLGNIRWRVVSWKMCLLAALLLMVLGAPIALFLAVNSFGLPTIHVGPITIPNMPSDPRYETLTGLMHGAGWRGYLSNAVQMLRLLYVGSDGLIWDSLPGYGYLFPGAIFFSYMGLAVILTRRKRYEPFFLAAFLLWLTLGFVLGLMQPPVMNRVNIIFLPLVMCVAVALDWVWRRNRSVVFLLTAAWILFSALFLKDYFGKANRAAAGLAFNAGILPAIQAAAKDRVSPVCVTDAINQPYIYVELAENANPREYLPTIQYESERDAFRVVEKMGRFTFGLSRCAKDASAIYVLRNDEHPPAGYEDTSQREQFINFTVYWPKEAGKNHPAD